MLDRSQWFCARSDKNIKQFRNNANEIEKKEVNTNRNSPIRLQFQDIKIRKE